MGNLNNYQYNTLGGSKGGNYIFVYDISCDRERYKVNKILKGYGFRIQKSVFECMLDKTMKRKLIEKLEKLDLQTGFIKMYKQEYSTKKKIIGAPQPPLYSDDNEAAFIV